MKIWQSRSGGVFCVRLDRGEEICGAVRAVAEEKGLRAGSVTGIGALEKVELGYFDVATKEYEHFHLDGSWELLSLTGNLAARDGELFPHLHAVLGFRQGEVRGGHLFSGTVSVTGEIFLLPFPVPIHRALDPEVNLALMDH